MKSWVSSAYCWWQTWKERVIVAIDEVYIANNNGPRMEPWVHNSNQVYRWYTWLELRSDGQCALTGFCLTDKTGAKRVQNQWCRNWYEDSWWGWHDQWCQKKKKAALGLQSVSLQSLPGTPYQLLVNNRKKIDNDLEYTKTWIANKKIFIQCWDLFNSLSCSYRAKWPLSRIISMIRLLMCKTMFHDIVPNCFRVFMFHNCFTAPHFVVWYS